VLIYLVLDRDLELFWTAVVPINEFAPIPELLPISELPTLKNSTLGPISTFLPNLLKSLLQKKARIFLLPKEYGA